MIAVRVLVMTGLVAVAFGYWGVHTEAGRRRFDEMAGMLPLFSLVAGITCIIVALAIFGYLKWKS